MEEVARVPVPDRPTIAIRARWFPSLLQLFGGLMLLGVSAWASLRQTLPPGVVTLGWIGGGIMTCLGIVFLADRRPKALITAEGIDVKICRTGLIRWQEIIHVESFRLRDQDAVAMFLTAEAQARLPCDNLPPGTPIFANEAFSGPPVWFGDGPLEYTARDIAAEITARRRGDVGPLTARLQRR
jgi:hypothetical protein